MNVFVVVAALCVLGVRVTADSVGESSGILSDLHSGIGVSSGYGGAYGRYGDYRGYGKYVAPVVSYSPPAYVYSPSVVAHNEVVNTANEATKLPVQNILRMNPINNIVAAPVSLSGYTGYGNGRSAGYFGYLDYSSHPNYHEKSGYGLGYASSWW